MSFDVVTNGPVASAGSTLRRSSESGTSAPTDVEIRITDGGEVMYRSPGVFECYYKNEESTRETKTADGWVHTGDAGFFDERGHLKIIDRAKDVGKLNDGALFAPKYIENKLKFFPHIKEVVAYGDQRDYCAAFINIDLEAVGLGFLVEGGAVVLAVVGVELEDDAVGVHALEIFEGAREDHPAFFDDGDVVADSDEAVAGSFGGDRDANEIVDGGSVFTGVSQGSGEGLDRELHPVDPAVALHDRWHVNLRRFRHLSGSAQPDTIAFRAHLEPVRAHVRRGALRAWRWHRGSASASRPQIPEAAVHRPLRRCRRASTS